MIERWNAKKLCQQTEEFLIAHKLLPSYVKSGRYNPTISRHRSLFSPVEQKNLHYSGRNGLLYNNLSFWYFDYQLIRSFTLKGSTDSCLFLPDLYSLPVDADSLLKRLPSIFAQLNFRVVNIDNIGQHTTFELSDESCKVEDLPEPYGKWLHHQLGRVEWDKPEPLKITISCQLFPKPDETYLTLTLSALAIPLLYSLTQVFNSCFHLQGKLLADEEIMTYLQNKAVFSLEGGRIDLTMLTTASITYHSPESD